MSCVCSVLQPVTMKAGLGAQPSLLLSPSAFQHSPKTTESPRTQAPPHSPPANRGTREHQASAGLSKHQLQDTLVHLIKVYVATLTNTHNDMIGSDTDTNTVDKDNVSVVSMVSVFKSLGQYRSELHESKKYIEVVLTGRL